MQTLRPNTALRASTIAVVLGVTACAGGSGSPSAPTPSTVQSSAPSAATKVIDDDEPRYVYNVLTQGGGGIVVARLDGKDAVYLGLDVAGVRKRDDWSPDGRSIVFVEEQSETMWLAHLDGSPSEQLPGCDGDGCDYPAFSPDGSQIAFSRAEPGGAGPSAVSIQVLDLTTGDIRTVIRLERPLLADVPRWSGDGTHLVIGVDRMDGEGNETGAAIATVPVNGGKLHYLTEFKDYAYSPDWNRVTGQIVFGPTAREFRANVQLDEETWDVFVIEPDGSGFRRVTKADTGEQFRGAKWTPDGTAILAWSSLTGAVRIDPVSGAISTITAPDGTGAPRLRP